MKLGEKVLIMVIVAIALFDLVALVAWHLEMPWQFPLFAILAVIVAYIEWTEPINLGSNQK